MTSFREYPAMTGIYKVNWHGFNKPILIKKFIKYSKNFHILWVLFKVEYLPWEERRSRPTPCTGTVWAGGSRCPCAVWARAACSWRTSPRALRAPASHRTAPQYQACKKYPRCVKKIWYYWIYFWGKKNPTVKANNWEGVFVKKLFCQPFNKMSTWCLNQGVWNAKPKSSIRPAKAP